MNMRLHHKYNNSNKICRTGSPWNMKIGIYELCPELTPGVASWTVNAEWVKVKHWMKDCADTPETEIKTRSHLPMKLDKKTYTRMHNRKYKLCDL